MIVGIGCDVTEISRVEKSIEKKHFTDRIFTLREQNISENRATFYSDNFAVKEAVFKCFGTGVSSEMTDVEVLRDEKGKPYVNLYGDAKKLAQEMGITNLYVTISNTRELSFACAVAENNTS